VWLWFTGEWTEGEIDHVSGIKDDNRIGNLRLATRSQNNANSRVYKNNKLGIKGDCKIGEQIRGDGERYLPPVTRHPRASPPGVL